MEYFIFRNNTIESFFAKFDAQMSGYDDISYVPVDAERFIWFYQVPFHFNREVVSGEILSYVDKIKFLLTRIPEHKSFIIFSLVNIVKFNFLQTDNIAEDAIAQYNQQIKEISKQYKNVKVIDFSNFTSKYAAEQLFSWRFYCISQMGLNPQLAASFSSWFANEIRALSLKRKKCIVLDLDNTLWGGVLGEEGVSGIKIGGDYPGKAFLYFQEGLVELAKRGIILAVCSKNNEADVLEVWENNPFVLLKQEYISAYRINWNNKADNIRALAEELNIGMDSMVFIDDNPTERELVKQLLPMVDVPDFPAQPYLLPQFLMDINDRYFKIYDITSEDLQKTAQYKANAARSKEQEKFDNLDEFLKSLEIKLSIAKIDEFSIARIAQMTQKTNQFNLTTKRYTESDVREFLSKGWLIYSLSISDKFGDSGISGTIFLEPIENGYTIDTILLSCRVLGKGIEMAFLQTVMNELFANKNQKVEATYIPTLKNAQVADFYERNNFKLVETSEQGVKQYVLQLNKAFIISDIYTINK